MKRNEWVKCDSRRTRCEFSLTTRDQHEAAGFAMTKVDQHRAPASFTIHSFIKNNCFSLTAGT